jgi:hypothetical protein
MRFDSSLFGDVTHTRAAGKDIDGMMDVGVAMVDITPETPIRLAGFAAREKSETNQVLRRLSAKALVFGSDVQGPSMLITVDLIGIQWRITKELVEQLSKRTGINPSQIVICATHTHGSPETGNLINILQCRGDYPQKYSFNDSRLASDQLNHITEYNELLSRKLAEAALAALADRKPAVVAWGRGEATFAANRRTEGGPVDHTLLVLSVANPGGKLRAILANYACHGITLGPEVNEIHGDWMGAAQDEIEANYPGTIAMVSIGCAGDQHPKLQGKTAYLKLYGQEIADHVDKVLKSHQMQQLTSPPVTKIKWIKLPFHQVPTIAEFVEFSKDTTIKGYYSRLALERVLSGETIPSGLDYPVQVWNFDGKMIMVNMGGEPVVDYSLMLKNKIGAERVWLNAYANDVSCYIPSKRVLKEGGYEAEASMYWYNQPSPFSKKVEELIVNTILDMVS